MSKAQKFIDEIGQYNMPGMRYSGGLDRGPVRGGYQSAGDVESKMSDAIQALGALGNALGTSTNNGRMVGKMAQQLLRLHGSMR